MAHHTRRKIFYVLVTALCVPFACPANTIGGAGLMPLDDASTSYDILGTPAQLDWYQPDNVFLGDASTADLQDLATPGLFLMTGNTFYDFIGENPELAVFSTGNSPVNTPNFAVSVNTAPIPSLAPEPASIVLTAAGILAMLLALRRRQRISCSFEDPSGAPSKAR